MGLYMGPGTNFVSDVRPGVPFDVQEEAMKVNGFTMDRIQAAETAGAVDQNLLSYLNTFPVPDRKLIAIGWNVAGFDLPFIKRFLPQSFKKLSYRTVDLNAVCFTLDPVYLNAVCFTLDPVKWERHKKAAKSYAAEELASEFPGEKWHDALYDAAAAYHAWHYLRQAVNPEEIIQL